MEPHLDDEPEWDLDAELERRERDHAEDLEIVREAISMPRVKLVFEKGKRSLLLSRGLDGCDFRITSFDELGPIGHRDYGTTERDMTDMANEIGFCRRNNWQRR